MSHGDIKHDYHLVEPSPWPLIGAIAAIIMAVGLVTFTKGFVPVPEAGASGGLAYTLFGKGQPWLLLAGFGLMIYIMAGWWRDVTKEANQGDHTPVVSIGLRYGMILFIASEVMFFVAWFWGFFEFAIFHEARVGMTWDAGSDSLYADSLSRFKDWPPVGVETFNPFHLPLMNTLVLLLSGTTVTWAHHALQTGDRKGARNGLILTIILGMMFTALQAYEYAEAGFSYDGTIYGSAFFMATGFHGVHVIIGTIFLIVCLFRLLGGGFTPKQHFGFEAAAWYWHFVDVVWLFLFAFVYVAPYLILGH